MNFLFEILLCSALHKKQISGDRRLGGETGLDGWIADP